MQRAGSDTYLEFEVLESKNIVSQSGTRDLLTLRFVCSVDSLPIGSYQHAHWTVWNGQFGKSARRRFSAADQRAIYGHVPRNPCFRTCCAVHAVYRLRREPYALPHMSPEGTP